MECEVWIVVAASPIDTVKAETRECRSLKTRCQVRGVKFGARSVKHRVHSVECKV